jgi:hypothetical protein
LAAFLAAGVSKDDALTMAGYSPKSEVYRDARIKESVQQMRERLQQTKGYTLVDSVEFYKKMADDSEVKPETRIKAKAQQDKLLGHEATKKIEVSETRELSVAIDMLSRLPVPMTELMRIATEAEVVDDDLKTLEGADVVAAPIG